MVGVRSEYNEETRRTEIQLLYSDKNQMNYPDVSIRILLAGVSLLIRSVEEYDSGHKSHELLEMAIDELKNHYVDPDSFADVENSFINRPNG